MPPRHSDHTDLDALPFDPKWVPLHPVDEPVVGHCAWGDCRAPLYRRGQVQCADCRKTMGRRGVTRIRKQVERLHERKEQERIAKLRAATLANDAIDRCGRCNNDGLLRGGGVCDH